MNMKRSRVATVGIFLGVVLFAAAPAFPVKGHFEFGFHYGAWSVNILRGPIENMLSDALKTEFRDKFLEEIRKETPGFEQTDYSQKVSFDSGGNNFGFEARWYPGGENGSFSLGISVEKTKMKVSLPEVSASLVGRDSWTGESGSLSGKVNGELQISPLSFHLDFRWDFWPSARIHPYMSFGLGIAGASVYDNGTVNYNFQADFITPTKNEHYSDSSIKTFRQLEQEGKTDENGNPKPSDFKLPGFFPFVSSSIGLKAKITDNIHLLIDYGIFDGFLLRGGLAIRI